MEYGISNLSIIPLRAEPNDRSEQVSQVLFGESFEITEWKENWVRIISAYDSYEGWIGRQQFTMLGHVAYRSFKHDPPLLTYRAITQAWKIVNNSVLYLPIGSSLSFLEGTTCYVGNERFEIIGVIGDSENLLASALSFLNTPYLWGGRTHFGIDCSGFTQTVFRLQGISLLRDASMQIGQGDAVYTIKEGKLGDLAFFENGEGRIVHVGILLGNGKIIHASGRVKIDSIDEKGIYAEDLNRYTHKLTAIRRYF